MEIYVNSLRIVIGEHLLAEYQKILDTSGLEMYFAFLK